MRTMMLNLIGIWFLAFFSAHVLFAAVCINIHEPFPSLGVYLQNVVHEVGSPDSFRPGMFFATLFAVVIGALTGGQCAASTRFLRLCAVHSLMLPFWAVLLVLNLPDLDDGELLDGGPGWLRLMPAAVVALPLATLASLIYRLRKLPAPPGRNVAP